MRAFLYLLLAPLALAHFGGGDGPGGPDKKCPTKTVFARPTATVTTYLQPKTKVVVDREACTKTITRTYNQRTTEYATTTKTKTVNPTITEAPRATQIVSKTAEPVTTCSTANTKPKASDIPDDMTNAERLRRGLPIRNPRERRHGQRPAQPSACVPTTTTIAWGRAPTVRVRNTVTSTVTKCAQTSVAYAPAFKTMRKTKVEWATAAGTRTVTRPNPSPTTTIVVQVTPTHYTGTCDGANNAQ